MKFVWEDSDVKVGRKVRPSNGASEVLMIGYIPGDGSFGKQEDRSHYCLISMSDGAVTIKDLTATQLAVSLTENNYAPLFKVGGQVKPVQAGPGKKE